MNRQRNCVSAFDSSFSSLPHMIAVMSSQTFCGAAIKARKRQEITQEPFIELKKPKSTQELGGPEACTQAKGGEASQKFAANTMPSILTYACHLAPLAPLLIYCLKLRYWSTPGRLIHQCMPLCIIHGVGRTDHLERKFCGVLLEYRASRSSNSLPGSYCSNNNTIPVIFQL